MSSAAVLELAPWVERAADGDAEAFGRLVQATAGTVHTLALAILRDVHTAEEVSQEVFLAAWQGLGQLRNPDSFLPWMRQLTRFRARSRLREDGRRRARLDEGAFDMAVATAIDSRIDAEATLVDRETRVALDDALDALPEDAREVLVLFYREDRSSRHVAELLGLSDAAVRQRLSRARTVLRREVLERLAEASRRSAPGAAFIAGVIAQLTVPASASAAAALLGASAKPAAAGLGTALLVALPGVAAGAAGGVAGVVLGLRRDLRDAADPLELRQLSTLRRVTVTATVAASLCLPLSWLAIGPPGPIAVFLAFVGYLAWAYLVWLPAIQARRRTAELAADPAALPRWRRRRLLAWVGLLAGLLCGGAGLLFGLLLAGAGS
ncbi:MAG TPA: sigma-70 family RNA polymerase sigma factor [Thermoanaerobaculia bacterium]|nr:sigma-70 family RNA polymerase sigma factor [Thermoanaerobaculia bacterium]